MSTREEAEQGGQPLTLHQARGNTWYLAGWQLIPLYRVGKDKCILLDTGLLAQRQAIEDTLHAYGITPLGILGTHAHTDHSPNHRYFKEKYHIPVALPLGEAGLCSSLLNLKAYFFMITPRQAAEEADVAQMVLRTDRVILPEEERISFCGVDFDIVHTPGHSPDHICIRTPDGVLYLGDALLTGEGLKWAKVPYFFSLEEGIASMEQLRREKASLYLAAHRGVYEDVVPLVEENIAAIRDRAAQICRLVDRPITEGELHRRTREHFKMLTSDLSRAGRYVRDIQNYVEYLRDTGQLRVYAKLGTIYYAPQEEKERTEP